MFGIVTEPYGGDGRRRVVVLVNNGADYHIGSARMYVSLARRWARSGYVVLRMDLAGLGDSNTRQGRPDNEVFPPAAVEDMRVAVEFMRDSYQVGDLTLAGLCSGAYHALRAGLAAVPLNRIFMVNPENFSWKEGTPIDFAGRKILNLRHLLNQAIAFDGGAGGAQLLDGGYRHFRPDAGYR